MNVGHYWPTLACCDFIWPIKEPRSESVSAHARTRSIVVKDRRSICWTLDLLIMARSVRFPEHKRFHYVWRGFLKIIAHHKRLSANTLQPLYNMNYNLLYLFTNYWCIDALKMYSWVNGVHHVDSITHYLPTKGTLHFFWKQAHFTTPQELNSWVLPFLNPFSRSPGLAVALLA